MTRQDAHALLPRDAKWFCSFGNPGQERFREVFHTPDGRRFIIENGDTGRDWTMREAGRAK